MSLFSPTRYVASVDRIDLEELFAQGKRAILLDRDNTLVPRDRATAPDEVAAWLERRPWGLGSAWFRITGIETKLCARRASSVSRR